VGNKAGFGYCKLTGNYGRYVKSHIIPEALTETLWKGKGPLIQRGGNGRRVRLGQTSWYDRGLVTADGEAILSKCDSWAIEFFRERKLIWSSWGVMEELELPDHEWGPERQFGYRKLENVDSDRLRLFFLSLLWRAAVTTRYEFSVVSLSPEELDQLRDMVVSGQVEPYHFYPAVLMQFSTRNFPHNMAAGRSVKYEPIFDPDTGLPSQETGREIQYYRFFFDGLVAHVHINDDAAHVEGLGSSIVGGRSEILLATMPSEYTGHMKHLWNEMGMAEPPSSLTRRCHLF